MHFIIIHVAGFTAEQCYDGAYERRSAISYYVYMLECVNGAYYTGITIQPATRWSQHLAGTAAKYTRSFPPKAMVALWNTHTTRNVAQKIEYKIKSLSRIDKLALINDPSQLKLLLSQWDISCDFLEKK